MGNCNQDKPRKVDSQRPFDPYVAREIAANKLLLLPILLPHLARVATLPFHHRDAFDRLLISQAIVEGFPILSADPAFDGYPVTRLW
jgi:PIN domain nuclease of toxin-antitoxin system